MGYDSENIVAIFHTHGHIDHFGCTQRLVEISGAKTYISRIDNDIVNGKLDLSWSNEIGMEHLPFFDCDVLVEDGDVFSFGNTTIKCVLTPGHTAGVLSLFITLEDNGKRIVAAMHGGIGFNSMQKDYLEKYGLSFSCRTQFKESLGKLPGEHVDIVLGNHPEQTKTLQKMIKVFSGESIIDTDEWQNFIQYNERRINKFLREHPEQ